MKHNLAIRELSLQFFKFAGVGVIGTLAHFIVLIGLVQLTGLNAVAASSAGALVGALVNYFLNYHYTFASSKRHLDAISKFLIVATVGFVLNGLLMTLLTAILSVYYLLAQILTTGTVLVWNFIGNRLWTFREKARHNG